jgi:chemotaxis response regulator CheB
MPKEAIARNAVVAVVPLRRLAETALAMAGSAPFVTLPRVPLF